MSNTLTIRLPEELLDRLREKSRRTGLPMGQVVRQSLEAALRPDGNQVWRKYSGILKDGPPDLSYARDIRADSAAAIEKRAAS